MYFEKNASRNGCAEASYTLYKRFLYGKDKFDEAKEKMYFDRAKQQGKSF